MQTLLLPILTIVALLLTPLSHSHADSSSSGAPHSNNSPTQSLKNNSENIIVTPFSVDYNVLRNNLHLANIKRQLTQQANGRYLFKSTSKPVGLLYMIYKDTASESSIWAFYNSRPRPLIYQYLHRNGKKTKRSTRFEFDWKKQQLTGTAKNRSVKREAPVGLQDKLLYQLTVMFDLMDNKKTLSYSIADGSRNKQYDYEILGQETLKTKIGSLETVKLKRLNDDQQTTIWCAKKYNYLVVRIDQIEDGAKMVAEISRLEGLPWKTKSQ